MWVILPNNADWDCFKTPILQEILRTENPFRVEHCAFFWKSYICSNKLDVQEANLSFTQMIIKGRSPAMRHVSRTERVALDWLFDRINLDPKIQIKYSDTKNQHADILTKGNFTRDEWNHLLCL